MKHDIQKEFAEMTPEQKTEFRHAIKCLRAAEDELKVATTEELICVLEADVGKYRKEVIKLFTKKEPEQKTLAQLKLMKVWKTTKHRDDK